MGSLPHHGAQSSFDVARKPIKHWSPDMAYFPNFRSVCHSVWHRECQHTDNVVVDVGSKTGEQLYSVRQVLHCLHLSKSLAELFSNMTNLN